MDMTQVVEILPSSKTRTYLFYWVNIVLATKGAMASTTMILFTRWHWLEKVPIPPAEILTRISLAIYHLYPCFGGKKSREIQVLEVLLWYRFFSCHHTRTQPRLAKNYITQCMMYPKSDTSLTSLPLYSFIHIIYDFEENLLKVCWYKNILGLLPWVNITHCQVISNHGTEYHVEAKTKWLPFSRWYIQMHFLEWKCTNFA